MARIEKIAKAKPAGIILREKDLPEEAYESLAKEVMEICRTYGTPCILHTFVDTAAKLGAKALHLPLPVLRTLSENEKKGFTVLGASCHSPADAKEAERLGCTYLTAGHVFDTDCKKGLPGRGIDFLKEVCESVSIPVFAIGGISHENIQSVREAGAKGACVMSSVMVCEDTEAYLAAFCKGGQG